QIDKTRDPTFTDGNVALAVTSFDKGGGTVEFEEITISQR
ncbi:MAG: zinc ribbon domain-containing protein, partial [Chloroflexi bacterium]